jgi:hypothetical protein
MAEGFRGREGVEVWAEMVRRGVRIVEGEGEVWVEEEEEEGRGKVEGSEIVESEKGEGVMRG